jgi:hypothetical protein
MSYEVKVIKKEPATEDPGMAVASRASVETEVFSQTFEYFNLKGFVRMLNATKTRKPKAAADKTASGRAPKKAPEKLV